MPKFDKEFFIQDTKEKFDLSKRNFMDLVENRHNISEEEFLEDLSCITFHVCYYGDLLEVLKE